MKMMKQSASRRNRLLHLRLPTAVLCLVLTGCMVGPKYNPPPRHKPRPPTKSRANVPPHPPAPNATTSTDPTLGGLGDWTVAQPQDACCAANGGRSTTIPN